MTDLSILVVDDEELMRDFLFETLNRQNYDVEIAKNGKAALEKIKDNDYQLVITDMKMPEITGIDLLRKVKEKDPETFVVVLTAYGTVENAVEAMKLGAFDYLMKPCTPEEIELLVERVCQFRSVLDENKMLKSQLKEKYDTRSIIGKSQRMTDVFNLIETVAATRATVLINGESGTGKELAARAIHFNSDRKDNAFVKMNCAALPEGLIESELFGHEKGAFTGAVKQTTGRFGLADGGTILLDEISEISPNLQAKLLRVLQEKEFERVGGHKTIKVDVRVIATTNRDLKKEIEEGNFREDLYYRLNVFPIEMPPLRDRMDDVPLLAKHFTEKFSMENGFPLKEINEEAMERLMGHSWDGNVRELENTIERAVILSKTNIIDKDSVCLDSSAKGTPFEQNDSKMSDVFGNKTMADIERDAILAALKKHKNNRTKAAETLKISIRTLRNKLSEYRSTGALPSEYELKQE